MLLSFTIEVIIHSSFLTSARLAYITHSAKYNSEDSIKVLLTKCFIYYRTDATPQFKAQKNTFIFNIKCLIINLFYFYIKRISMTKIIINENTVQGQDILSLVKTFPKKAASIVVDDDDLSD